MYSTEPRIEHAGAFLRESRPREIALSLLRARRFPRNLGFTNHLGTVQGGTNRTLKVNKHGGSTFSAKKINFANIRGIRHRSELVFTLRHADYHN